MGVSATTTAPVQAGGSYAAGNTQFDGSASVSRPSDEPGFAEINIVFNIAPASYTFTTPVANPFGIGTSASSAVYPTFADINGDGTQDLFVGSCHLARLPREYRYPRFIQPSPARSR